MITAGIDIGSLSAQAVIVGDTDILSYSNIIAGVDRIETADKVFLLALKSAELKREDVEYIVGTGYGRYSVPFAAKSVTEITCHARGANYFLPNVRTVLDMGGQDCKAIRCDERGTVKAFVMNDKCAAGTGRSMEVISKLLNIPLEDIGPLSLKIEENPPQLSNVCVVFAKSEALQLIRSGVSRNEVLAAYCDALARRIVLLIKKTGMEEEFMISGGIGKNVGVVKRIEENLNTKANICFEPQIVGALGAALIARDLLKKNLSRDSG
ncbi:acyl-CoA dehydratase activase [Thermodesulfobacteriota bacterium]